MDDTPTYDGRRVRLTIDELQLLVRLLRRFAAHNRDEAAAADTVRLRAEQLLEEAV